MVVHAVRAAGIRHRAAAADAYADDALAVPVGKFHQVQKPNRTPRSEVVLPPLAALVFGVGAGRCARYIGQRLRAGFGVIAGDRIIAADILAGAGMLGKAAFGLVRDVEVPLFVGGIINDSEVIFRNINGGIIAASGKSGRALFIADRIVDDVVLLHATPGKVAVERGAAGAGAERGRRLCGNVDIDQPVRVAGLSQTAQGRRLRAVVPAHAEDLYIGQLQRIVGIGTASDAAGGCLAVQRSGDAPGAGVRQIELCCPGTGSRERGGAVDRLDGRAAVNGHGESAELHRGGVAAAGG